MGPPTVCKTIQTSQQKEESLHYKETQKRKTNRANKVEGHEEKVHGRVRMKELARHKARAVLRTSAQRL